MKLKNPQGGGGGASLLERLKYNQDLIGLRDSVNKIFATPHKFLYETTGLEPVFKRNGQTIYLGKEIDEISESGGVGTGYNQVLFKKAPKTGDVLTADYISLL